MKTAEQASQKLRSMSLALLTTDEEHLRDLWMLALTQFKSSELRRWREEVVRRDGATCRMCGKSEFLEAHHIFPKALWPEQALLIGNGITLCYPCHRCVVHGCTSFDLANFKLYTRFFTELVKQNDPM